MTTTGQPKDIPTTCRPTPFEMERGLLKSSEDHTQQQLNSTSSPDILPTFVFVRDFEGRSIVININDNTTVNEICAEALRRSSESVVAPYPPESVARSEVNSMEEMRLQYGGKILTGDRTLRECNIQPGSTLELSTRLNGGIDGMTIMAFAIMGAIALYLLYRLVLLIFKFAKWLWRFLLRAPVCWFSKNCCAPVCSILRTCIYTLKETCCALCDCCDLHYHPWKRMDITS